VVELVAALVLIIGPVPPNGPTIAWGDAQHVWAGGGGGILASSTGGTAWRRQTRWPALQLSAVDARHAWALSEQGLTIRTTDGVHWRSLGVQHLLSIGFVDARHGYAIERDDFLMRTSDGGVTWRPTGGPQRLQSMCFSTASTGWVARGGAVWTTHDSAHAWKQTTLRPARQGFPVPELGCRGRDVWVLFHEGAAAGTEGYHAYRSLDAGATWKAVLATPFDARLPHISNYSGPFSVIGGHAAVFEGSCSPCGSGTVTFVRTVDGGHTFARTTLRNLRPGAVAFADRRHGLAVLTPSPRGAPAVWRTVDGGRRWRPVLHSSALTGT
jgi:photosystem II stability/assembly factor-like uncharacterized protein